MPKKVGPDPAEATAPQVDGDAMTTLTFRGHEFPGEMTKRARAYLLIAAVRHTLLGLACMLVPQGFTSDTYESIKGVVPLPPDHAIAGWGGLFLATGIFAAVAAWLGREGEARWALLASVLTSALWAGGFIVYIGTVWAETGLLTNPSGPIIWTAITLKDITMLRNPLVNPFEQLVRSTVTEVEADGR